MRWRELQPDGQVVAKSWTVEASPADAERWALRVHEALQVAGTFVRPEPGLELAPVIEGDLRVLFLEWAKWRAAHRGLKSKTIRIMRSSVARIEEELRRAATLPADGPIPASVLTPTIAGLVLQQMAESVGRPRQVQVMAALYDAWAWASDELDRWPGLRPVPRLKAKVVPSAHRRSRPDPAPTVGEMDAVIRRAAGSLSPLLAEFLAVQRCTGLRQFQVQGLLPGDVLDLDSPVPRLRVRHGKSAQEREGRIVPVPPVLVPVLRKLLAGADVKEPLLGRRAPINSSTLWRLFEAVEGAGEIRPAVWRSDGRANTRTTHVMRAGYQRMMRRAGVEDRVIDVLVGHAGKTTRDRHYDDSDWAEQGKRSMNPSFPPTTAGYSSSIVARAAHAFGVSCRNLAGVASGRRCSTSRR
ncbi:MAG: tyrosine-type recombinase/integrase [Myxococcota bacterium]